MTLATFDNLPMELVLMILSEIPTIRGRYALLQASNRHRGSAFEIVTLPMITSGAGKHVYILKEPVNRYQLVGPVVLGEARRVNGRLLVDAWRHKNTIEKEFQFGYGSEKYKRKFITMFFPRPTNRYCYELDWDRDCRGQKLPEMQQEVEQMRNMRKNSLWYLWLQGFRRQLQSGKIAKNRPTALVPVFGDLLHIQSSCSDSDSPIMEDRVYGYFQGDPPQYENMPLCSCVSSACSHSSLILTVVCVPKQMRYYNLNGYAAVRAYTAYGNEEFLDFAVRAWEFERNNTVSISDVPLPLQNSSFKELYDAYRQCDNCEMPPLPQLMSNLTDHISLSGQFGWRTDGTMASSDNGLSSLLAEITGNNTFLEAAMESEEFILSQLYDDGSLLKWGISMDENNPCQLATKEDVDPWNAGYAIAGLAIMSSTYPANETIRQKRVSGSSSLRLSPSDWIYRLTNTILAATSFLAWHDGQGVMASVEKAGDMDLISGLFTAHTRDAVDSGLSSYLQGYLAVQYNAILDLATNNGTDIYGLAWIGPPPIEYSAQDQIIAAHVLYYLFLPEKRSL
uniref:Glycoside hydrolase family 76 protein n=1 Tax=Moniliophthora roreri TaxID=221103 RepID=A0A0W0EYH1_MONRR